MNVMSPEIKEFRVQLENSQIYNPDGPHHELASGNHAHKVDFDKIKTANRLYNDWVSLTAADIANLQFEYPLAIVGVANGANRLARDIPRYLTSNVVGLRTKKEAGEVPLTQESQSLLTIMRPKSVLIVDDVGTTGGSIAQVAHFLRENTFIEPEAISAHVSWQRQEQLTALDERDISYSALIKEVLPMYSPEECETSGFCSQGVPLILREQ